MDIIITIIWYHLKKKGNAGSVSYTHLIDEDLVNGDVNPYTGHEYRTNSVRMHPHRIGYVQVYDRKDHKWTDMTERCV